VGGWISLIGENRDFERRLNAFKKIFAAGGVPELRVEVHRDGDDVASAFWAWSLHRVPDIQLVKNQDASAVVCGAVTDIGRFGPLPGRAEDAARRILDIWLDTGDGFIDQVNGSFSFLFARRNPERLSLFTDRFASRSVWWNRDGDAWIVGNFPSAIAAWKAHTPKIDPAGLWSLLHTGRHIGSHGLYDGIHALQAGQAAAFGRDAAIAVRAWWRRRYQPERNASPREWGERISAALSDSAGRSVKTCRNPHLFLSGGLDSRIAAASLKKSVRTVTLCTRPNAESRLASLVSKRLGQEHATIIRDPYWYLDTQGPAALISGGNYLDYHAHFMAPVVKMGEARPDSEFFLGDLLENLNKHYFQKSAAGRFSFDADGVERIMHSCVPSTVRDPERLGIFLRGDIRDKVREAYRAVLSAQLRSLADVSEDNADRLDTFLRWADVSVTYTYNMLACIWPLAGERNLFFDNPLNDIALKIPSDVRGAGLLHKWTLYHLDKKLLLLPDANDFLPVVLPGILRRWSRALRPIAGKLRRRIYSRRGGGIVTTTSGSWLLLHEYYRKDPRYREHIGRILGDPALFPPEIFEREHIRATWERFLAGEIGLLPEIEALLSFGRLQERIATGGLAS